ncbi:MAG: HNH endonuclease [Actinobacteria bacterium]|nr:HNH endonuclease [Actinomycetota bacterium]
MNWRIAANGVALVVAISGVAGNVSAVTEATQKFVANDAKSVLATIRVENEYKTGYKRSLFIHWSDLDGDGCDTREEVLKRDSTSKPQVDPYRCYVVAGDWFSKYDGKTLSDRSDVDIDHVVALKEAWDSGAWSWSESQRKAYANDLTDRRSLIAVNDRVNMSKGDKDPSNWIPPLKSYWCTYLGDWISIKARWDLSMDQSEFGRIKNLLSSDCSSLTISGWSATPVAVSAPATANTTATAPVVTTPVVTSPASVTTVKSPTSSTVAPSSGSGSSATTPTTNATATTVAQSGVKDIYPGSYCAPVDGLGTYKGTPYICSKTNAEGSPYAGGRARWRKATN